MSVNIESTQHKPKIVRLTNGEIAKINFYIYKGIEGKIMKEWIITEILNTKTKKWIKYSSWLSTLEAVPNFGELSKEELMTELL